MKLSKLPRLLYIGDVPVESTVAGSALIYRLLQEYPISQLLIIEGNLSISQPINRLEGVEYQTLNLGSQRLLNSRLNYLYNSYLFLTARQRASQLTKIIEVFRPEAILTVAHRYSWLTAAELAERYQLPIHLIVHDDLPSYISLFSWLKTKFTVEFGNVYRKATSRLCVSPYMVECYEQRYGVTGNILYPSRAKDTPVYEAIPVQERSRPHVLAYAGSISSQAFMLNLKDLAATLQSKNWIFLIYSQINENNFKQMGLDLPNVRRHSLLPYQKLIQTLRQEADILFLPMGFEAESKTHTSTNFPSKLADYTAIGLPILIWGPSYCSAVRWAKENSGTCALVETPDIAVLANSIQKLAEDRELQRKLGSTTLTIGQKYFSHAKAIEQFYQAINLDRIEQTSASIKSTTLV